jgi:hypothetical protein
LHRGFETRRDDEQQSVVTCGFDQTRECSTAFFARFAGKTNFEHPPIAEQRHRAGGRSDVSPVGDAFRKCTSRSP